MVECYCEDVEVIVPCLPAGRESISHRSLVRSSTGSSTRLLIGGSGFKSQRTDEWMNSSTVERWLVKPGVESSILSSSAFKERKKTKWNSKNNGENYLANGSKARSWMK